MFFNISEEGVQWQHSNIRNLILLNLIFYNQGFYHSYITAYIFVNEAFFANWALQILQGKFFRENLFEDTLMMIKSEEEHAQHSTGLEPMTSWFWGVSSTTAPQPMPLGRKIWLTSSQKSTWVKQRLFSYLLNKSKLWYNIFWLCKLSRMKLHHLYWEPNLWIYGAIKYHVTECKMIKLRSLHKLIF